MYSPRIREDLIPQIYQVAKKAGLAWRTVERAKRELGVETHKRGFGGGWDWSLPRRPPTTPSRESGGLRGDTDGERVRAPSEGAGGGLREDADLPPDSASVDDQWVKP